MIGETYGRLTIAAAAPASTKEGPCWHCQCECGSALTVPYYRLKTGHTKSCGCLLSELQSEPRIVNEIGIYDPRRTNRHSAPHLNRLYILWRNILYRATERRQAKKLSCQGVCVAQEFRHFTDFVEWVMKQIGWDQGFDLDKDLLRKGNKVYGPETCVFLPPEVNISMANRARGRGPYPVGVSRIPANGKFAARLSIGRKLLSLGSYATTEQAFAAYKAGKEARWRELAEKYRDQIDPRAYQAMITRQVEITD